MTTLVRRAVRLAALLPALAALPACSGGGGGGGGTTPQKGAISGSVSTSAGAVPGAGVGLSPGGATATTGAGGGFTFGNLDPGTYTLTVTPPAGFSLGAEAASKSVAVQANQTASVAWTLVPDGGNPQLREVSLGGASFTPSQLSVPVGATVRWTNALSVAHTITPDDPGQAGAWTGAQVNGAGETFQHTFDAAGTYPYHCNFHAGMTGTITVQ